MVVGNNNNSSATSNWIALGGLIIAAVTCYFTFFSENKPEEKPVPISEEKKAVPSDENKGAALPKTTTLTPQAPAEITKHLPSKVKDAHPEASTANSKSTKESDEPPVKPHPKNYIANRTIDNVEMRITGFSQEGNIATVKFELENKDASNTVRGFPIYPGYQQLLDQNSNTFKSIRCVVGNIDKSTGNLSFQLVYGNSVKCIVEFNVGANTVEKIAYLKIGLGIKFFEFTNLPLK